MKKEEILTVVNVLLLAAGIIWLLSAIPWLAACWWCGMRVMIIWLRGL